MYIFIIIFLVSAPPGFTVQPNFYTYCNIGGDINDCLSSFVHMGSAEALLEEGIFLGVRSINNAS